LRASNICPHLAGVNSAVDVVIRPKLDARWTSRNRALMAVSNRCVLDLRKHWVKDRHQPEAGADTERELPIWLA